MLEAGRRKDCEKCSGGWEWTGLLRGVVVGCVVQEVLLGGARRLTGGGDVDEAVLAHQVTRLRPSVARSPSITYDVKIPGVWTWRPPSPTTHQHGIRTPGRRHIHRHTRTHAQTHERTHTHAHIHTHNKHTHTHTHARTHRAELPEGRVVGEADCLRDAGVAGTQALALGLEGCAGLGAGALQDAPGGVGVHGAA
jgi:hypothetical protein